MKLEDRKYILNALVKNAKTTAADLAEQLGASEQEVAAEIADLENQNIIRGYHALVNEDNLHDKPVKAIIEVRVRPEREGGFDRIARRLSNFPQVTALYLMSGGYDLMLEVRGADLNEEPCRCKKRKKKKTADEDKTDDHTWDALDDLKF